MTAIDIQHWQQRFDELAEKHGVPGAQLGILRVGGDAFGNGPEDELVSFAHGYLHVPAKIPVSTEAVFQIGSISKVWTATVAMQLVAEGLIGLDQPIVEEGPADEVLGDPSHDYTRTLLTALPQAHKTTQAHKTSPRP